MAHKISQVDRQEGTKQAWHGKTDVKQVIELDTCWLAQWNVEKRKMREPDGSESEYCRVVCTDDESIKIGHPVHCETYGMIDNKEFLAIVGESLLSIQGAKIESVGSVCERGRIFVSVSIPDLPELTAAGRKFEPLLNFLSSHDLSAPFLVNASTVCIVCNNTFGMNLHDSANKVFRVRVPHTKHASKKLADIPEMIDAYCGTQAKFAAILDKMETKQASVDDAERFFAGFLTVKDENEAKRFLSNVPERGELKMATRRANQLERLVDLFRNGAGNDGNDRSDLFQAATDYYSHESSGGNDPMKQVASSEFGSGATMKTRAFNVLSDDKLTKQLIDVGEEVMLAN